MLLKTSGTNYIPLEESFGGEIGIFYFVPLIAHYFQNNALTSVSFFLTGLVVCGCVSMAAALCCITQHWVLRLYSIGMTVAMGYVAWIIGDVYIAYFTAIALLPWLFVLSEKKILVMSCYFFSVGLCAYYIDFIRSYAALPLLVGCLWWLLLIIGYQKKMYKHAFLYFCFLCFGWWIVSFHIEQVLHQRDAFLADQGYIKNSNNKIQHTFWHSVYTGFGFITNDKDLNFSDACSAAKVASLDRTASCYSKKYEKLLCNEVVKLCIYSPHYVLRVMFAKLGIFIYLFLLFANIGIIAAWYYPKPWYIECFYLVLFLTSSLAGFATIPVGTYTLGFMTVACLYGMHSLLYAFCMRKKFLVSVSDACS